MADVEVQANERGMAGLEGRVMGGLGGGGGGGLVVGLVVVGGLGMGGCRRGSGGGGRGCRRGGEGMGGGGEGGIECGGSVQEDGEGYCYADLLTAAR